MVKPQGLKGFDPGFQEQGLDTLMRGSFFDCLDNGPTDTAPPDIRIDEEAALQFGSAAKECIASSTKSTPFLSGYEKPGVRERSADKGGPYRLCMG